MKRALVVLFVTGIAAAMRPPVVTTYARAYSVAARLHPNRRYHPDSMNVAAGWRYLRGYTLRLYLGGDSCDVIAKDVMNARYDNAPTLHLDCSPAVMRRLRLKHKSTLDSVRVLR